MAPGPHTGNTVINMAIFQLRLIEQLNAERGAAEIMDSERRVEVT